MSVAATKAEREDATKGDKQSIWNWDVISVSVKNNLPEAAYYLASVQAYLLTRQSLQTVGEGVEPLNARSVVQINTSACLKQVRVDAPSDALMARQTLESIKSVFELKDRIKKEEDAAYKFFMEHRDTLCSSDNLGTASKIIRHQLELSTLKNERCIKMLKAVEEKRQREELEHKKKLRELESDRFNTNGLPPLELMRPVTPEIRDTLYEGISATGGGRARYLKLRNRKNPEQKYNYKFPASWDYGWYFSELVKLDNIKKPFNRSDVIKNTLFGRNGIPMEHVGDVIQKKRFV